MKFCRYPLIALVSFMALTASLISLSETSEARSVRRKPAKQAAYASYPLPERNWIRSGMWAYGSTEVDRYYHTFGCPVLKRAKAPNLVGWDSANEALGSGYEPHPGCHPFDPREDKTPGARVKKKMNTAIAIGLQAQVAASKQNLPLASDLATKAMIAWGDSMMMWADIEKKAGRTQLADALYQRAATAYQSSQTGLESLIPSVPQLNPSGGGGGGGQSGGMGAGPGGPGGGGAGGGGMPGMGGGMRPGGGMGGPGGPGAMAH